MATLDYLAEGNDHMTAVAKVGDADKVLPEKEMCIRDRFGKEYSDSCR